jgi:hypothetical protein
VRPGAVSHHAQNHHHGGQNIERNAFDLVRDREALRKKVAALMVDYTIFANGAKRAIRRHSQPLKRAPYSKGRYRIDTHRPDPMA